MTTVPYVEAIKRKGKPMTGSMDGQQATVWKWITGCMFTVTVACFGTAMAFRVNASEIRQQVENTFTEVSQNRGMYAIEGRPRIEALERQIAALTAALSDMKERLARMESKLDQALKR